jgi:hypothetical protein
MRNESAKEGFGMKNEEIFSVAMSCGRFFHP